MSFKAELTDINGDIEELKKERYRKAVGSYYPVIRNALDRLIEEGDPIENARMLGDLEELLQQRGLNLSEIAEQIPRTKVSSETEVSKEKFTIATLYRLANNGKEYKEILEITKNTGLSRRTLSAWYNSWKSAVEKIPKESMNKIDEETFTAVDYINLVYGEGVKPLYIAAAFRNYGKTDLRKIAQRARFKLGELQKEAKKKGNRSKINGLDLTIDEKGILYDSGGKAIDAKTGYQ